MLHSLMSSRPFMVMLKPAILISRAAERLASTPVTVRLIAPCRKSALPLASSLASDNETADGSCENITRLGSL